MFHNEREYYLRFYLSNCTYREFYESTNDTNILNDLMIKYIEVVWKDFDPIIHFIDDFPDEKLIVESGINLADAKNIRFRSGKGCGHCRGTGFKGRKAIAEVLYLNDEIRELIIGREPIRLVREAARRNGTRFLRDGAVDLVIQGESTLQEINRVTFVA